MKNTILTIILCACALQSGTGQAGSLDPGFGSSGIATANFGRGNDIIYASAIMPGGKIAVAGVSDFHFALARYDANGVLDNTFGNGGIAPEINIGDIESEFKAIAIQADGKILAGGSSRNPNFYRGLAIARFNDDGTLDNTFGEGGVVITQISGRDYIHSLALQPDGKILAAGSTSTSENDFLIARYHPDGTIDSTFGTNGFVITALNSFSYDAIFSIALQSDGKIVAGGYSEESLTGSLFTLARYNPDGTLDAGFGTGGIVQTNLGFGYSVIHSVKIQPDGKIVAGGAKWSSFALARYNADGTLDASFGSGGIVVLPVSGNELGGGIQSIQLLNNGKIIACGSNVLFSGESDFAVARVNTDGSLDNTFNGVGYVIIPGAEGYNQLYSLAVQEDEKIVGAGFATVERNQDFVVLRLNQNGSPDNSFGTNGVVETALGNGSENASSFAMQADGKIVAAGMARVGNDYDLLLARFLPDGSLDNSFGNGGMVNHPELGQINYVPGTAMQEDGKILIVGWLYTPYNSFLARYQPDGSMDLSFGENGLVRDSTGISMNKLVIKTDGKIITGGSRNGDFILQQFQPDGNIDPTFGISGVVTTDFFGKDDQMSVLVIQPDGKIVAGGSATLGTSKQFALARYHPDGSLDNSFSTDGKKTISFFSYQNIISSLSLQPDGSILAGGITNASFSDGYDFALARFNADGSLDGSFGQDGKTTLNDDDFYLILNSIALQPDGKLIAAGSRYEPEYLQRDFILVRYNADGSLDNTFGNEGILLPNLGQGDISRVMMQPDNKILAGGTLGGDFALVRFLSGLEVGTIDLETDDCQVFIYPNPVSACANLSYQLAQNARISIALYSTDGRKMRTFIDNEIRRAGAHDELLNFAGLPTGSYFLTIENAKARYTIQVFK